MSCACKSCTHGCSEDNTKLLQLICWDILCNYLTLRHWTSFRKPHHYIMVTTYLRVEEDVQMRWRRCCHQSRSLILVNFEGIEASFNCVKSYPAIIIYRRIRQSGRKSSAWWNYLTLGMWTSSLNCQHCLLISIGDDDGEEMMSSVKYRLH